MARKPPPPGIGNETLRILALTHAQTVAPRVRELMQSGMTMKQVITTLDAEGIRTQRGGNWRAFSIQRVLDLTDGITAPEPPRKAAQPSPDDGDSDHPRRGRIV